MNEGTKVDLSGAAAAVKEMKKENTANLADAYVDKPVLNPDTIGARQDLLHIRTRTNFRLALGVRKSSG